MAKKNRKSSRASPPAPEGLTDRAREVWLAGLGALKTDRKRGPGWFEALVVRGERAHEEAGDAVTAALARLDATLRPLVERPRDVAAWAAGTAADALEGAVEAALDGLGVARRDDLDRLRARLRTLDTRLARLSGAPVPAPADFHVRPHGDAWAVFRDEAAEPLAVGATKKAALAEARRRARAAVPSRLVVHNRDGTTELVRAYAP